MTEPAGQLLSLPPPRLGAADLLALAQAHWRLTGTLTPLTSERDLNHRLDTATGSFVLKVANAAEPPGMTAFQTAALLHVAKMDPGLPTPRVVPAADGRAILAHPAGALRLLTWLAGTPLARLPIGPDLARSIGTALARLAGVLAAFDHPGSGHLLLWDIRHFARLAPLAPALPAALRPEFDRFLRRFETAIAPALAALPTQVVHADFNLHNLLADPGEPTRITGILDFGDMVRTHRICDLAVAASYLVVDPADPLALVAPLVAAYHARLPLLPAEVALLPDLVTARMLTSLTISAWRAGRYPENADYILRNAPSARRGLDALRAAGPRHLAETLRAACESARP